MNTCLFQAQQQQPVPNGDEEEAAEELTEEDVEMQPDDEQPPQQQVTQRVDKQKLRVLFCLCHRHCIVSGPSRSMKTTFVFQDESKVLKRSALKSKNQETSEGTGGEEGAQECKAEIYGEKVSFRCSRFCS